MSAELERLVAHIRAAFEFLNQKLVSRDTDVRSAIEYIAGQLEQRYQQLALNRRMEEDLAKRAQETERLASLYSEVQQWRDRLQEAVNQVGHRVCRLEEEQTRGSQTLQAVEHQLARTAAAQQQQYVEVMTNIQNLEGGLNQLREEIIDGAKSIEGAVPKSASGDITAQR